jgi:hypothetical protein
MHRAYLRKGDDPGAEHWVAQDVALKLAGQRLGRRLQAERKHLEQQGRLRSKGVLDGSFYDVFQA